MANGSLDRTQPHKLTLADGTVDTVTIPSEVAGREAVRKEVTVGARGDAGGRQITLVIYEYA